MKLVHIKVMGTQMGESKRHWQQSVDLGNKVSTSMNKDVLLIFM